MFNWCRCDNDRRRLDGSHGRRVFCRRDNNGRFYNYRSMNRLLRHRLNRLHRRRLLLGRREDLPRLLFQGQNVLVVQLPTNLVGTDFTFNFLFDRVEAALQPPNPQAGGARSTRQTLGAQYQQGNEADEQQFREADTKH